MLGYGEVKDLHTYLKVIRGSPKTNTFSAFSWQKVHVLFFFAESTMTGIVYLDTVQDRLYPELLTEFPRKLLF
jgi:hypothetical protein